MEKERTIEDEIILKYIGRKVDVLTRTKLQIMFEELRKELIEEFEKMINPENRVLVPDCPCCAFKIELLEKLKNLKEKKQK